MNEGYRIYNIDFIGFAELMKVNITQQIHIILSILLSLGDAQKSKKHHLDSPVFLQDLLSRVIKGESRK